MSSCQQTSNETNFCEKENKKSGQSLVVVVVRSLWKWEREGSVGLCAVFMWIYYGNSILVALELPYTDHNLLCHVPHWSCNKEVFSNSLSSTLFSLRMLHYCMTLFCVCVSDGYVTKNSSQRTTILELKIFLSAKGLFLTFQQVNETRENILTKCVLRVCSVVKKWHTKSETEGKR